MTPGVVAFAQHVDATGTAYLLRRRAVDRCQRGAGLGAALVRAARACPTSTAAHWRG